jgi:hypothetical protein
MSISTFLKAAPLSITARKAVALGLLSRRPVLPGAATFFFYLRAGLGAAAAAEAIFASATYYKSIFEIDYPLRPRAL